MLCPSCKTENRDDAAACFHCEQDLSALRRVINQSREHFNAALEHAERGRDEEAAGELKQAVALDASFVSAWVVLGSLYARREKLPEAEEAWKKALALDNRFANAHENLMKSRKLGETLPSMRRLRVLSVALAILLLGALAGLAIEMWPDRASGLVGEALTLRAEGRNEDALRALREAQAASPEESDTRAIAAALEREIVSGFGKDIKQARTLIAAEKDAEAAQLLGAILAASPPAAAMRKAKALAEEFDAVTIAELEEDLRRFTRGELEAERLRQALAEARALGRPEIEAAAARIGEQLGEREGRFVLAEAREAFAEQPTIQQCKALMETYARRHPKLRGALTDELRTRAMALWKERGETFKATLASGDVAGARAALDGVAADYAAAGLDPPEGELAEAKQQLAEAERDADFTAVELAFAEGHWDSVLEDTRNLGAGAWTEKQERQMIAWREQAQTEFAAIFWDWSDPLDQKWEDGSVSEADATRMWTWHEAAVESFRTDYSKACTLFRAALVAFHNRDDPAAAKGIIGRLETEFPNQDVLTWPAFRRLKNQLNVTEPAV